MKMTKTVDAGKLKKRLTENGKVPTFVLLLFLILYFLCLSRGPGPRCIVRNVALGTFVRPVGPELRSSA